MAWEPQLEYGERDGRSVHFLRQRGTPGSSEGPQLHPYNSVALCRSGPQDSGVTE